MGCPSMSSPSLGWFPPWILAGKSRVCQVSGIWSLMVEVFIFNKTVGCGREKCQPSRTGVGIAGKKKKNTPEGPRRPLVGYQYYTDIMLRFYLLIVRNLTEWPIFFFAESFPGWCLGFSWGHLWASVSLCSRVGGTFEIPGHLPCWRNSRSKIGKNKLQPNRPFLFRTLSP